MIKTRSEQELIEELIKRNLNYQSKSNKCVEAENDRRITGLARKVPRRLAISAHDWRSAEKKENCRPNLGHIQYCL
jgi:hypothetical protein